MTDKRPSIDIVSPRGKHGDCFHLQLLPHAEQKTKSKQPKKATKKPTLINKIVTEEKQPIKRRVERRKRNVRWRGVTFK